MVRSVALKIIDKSTLQMVSQLYQFPLQSWSHDVSSLALRCVFASNLLRDRGGGGVLKEFCGCKILQRLVIIHDNVTGINYFLK